MRLKEIVSLLFLAMTRVLKAIGKSVMDEAKEAGSQACPDPIFVPDHEPDEQRHAQEATSPKEGGVRCTGPPPDWLRRSQRGVPEHWLSLVRKHAPQLLEPIEDQDDGVSAMHCVMGKDGLEPMGAFEHQPIRDPEDIRAMQGFPAKCGDQESDAIHPDKGVDPKLRKSTSRPSRKSLGDPPQPVQGQEYIPRMSKKSPRVNHSRTARIESSMDSPGSTERLENGVVPVIRRETVQAQPETERLDRSAAGEPKMKMLDHGSGVPLALPPRSLKNQRNSEPWEETVAAGVAFCGKMGSRTAGFELLADPSESSQVTDKRGVQRLLLAPRVSDSEGSPQEWENLFESLSLSSSPGLPAEIPARRWPELMKERGMDFYDHQAAFDEREKRELLMQEQDGALWSV